VLGRTHVPFELGLALRPSSIRASLMTEQLLLIVELYDRVLGPFVIGDVQFPLHDWQVVLLWLLERVAVAMDFAVH